MKRKSQGFNFAAVPVSNQRLIGFLGWDKKTPLAKARGVF